MTKSGLDLIEACSACPVGALKVFDSDGNQLLP
jgi:hypothetical protein